LSSNEEVLRLVIPISGINLPSIEQSFEVEKDFVIVVSDQALPFPPVYAVFAVPDESVRIRNECVSKLSKFLDCFSYHTLMPADISGPQVWQRVSREKIMSPPFSKVKIFKRNSPEYAKVPLTAATNLAKRKLFKFLLNALTFYRRSLLARTRDESLVDLIIALESMFSLNSQEIRYRLSLWTAYFIGESNIQMRKQIYDLVYEMYGLRNTIVHLGGTAKSVDFVKVARLREVVRDAITKYLELDNNKKSCLEKIESRIMSG